MRLRLGLRDDVLSLLLTSARRGTSGTAVVPIDEMNCTVTVFPGSTVFALPFALVSMALAANGLPAASVIFWIIAACVFGRTAAMSFNRWADRELDKRNPRTADRAIPAEEPVTATGFDTEAQAVDRVGAAVASHEVFNLDSRHVGLPGDQGFEARVRLCWSASNRSSASRRKSSLPICK